MYTVTRQRQFPDGDNVVEISEGGIDYTNPDALGAKYKGEFQEFEDPREAVSIAIEICRQWRQDSEPKAKLGIGATGGYTMPFDSTTFKDARNWADEIWEKLEKCPACGIVMEDAKEWWNAGEWIGDEFLPNEDFGKYCSEYCAEKHSTFLVECLECRELVETKTAEPHPDEFDRYICPECLEKYDKVVCSLCGNMCGAKTAHLHSEEWIGDECCWDERLRASE